MIIQTVSYTVTNKDGLNVRSKMDTKTGAVLRKMAQGESFLVYQSYPVGNQVWGRLTSNPGNVSQEYACLTLANKTFAVPDNLQPHGVSINLQWIQEMDAWARSQAKPFTGSTPF